MEKWCKRKHTYQVWEQHNSSVVKQASVVERKGVIWSKATGLWLPIIHTEPEESHSFSFLLYLLVRWILNLSKAVKEQFYHWSQLQLFSSFLLFQVFHPTPAVCATSERTMPAAPGAPTLGIPPLCVHVVSSQTSHASEASRAASPNLGT